MPISHEHRCIFVHIPKCGGTSIELGLGMGGKNELFGFEAADGTRYDNSVGPRMKAEGRHDLICLQHLEAARIRSRYPPEIWSTYFTFSVVRNPFDLVVSDFSYHTQKRKDRLQMLGFGPDTSFEDYVHPGFRAKQQRQFLVDEGGDIIVDFVARFENLERDFAHICETIGAGITLPHANRTVRSPYREYYDDDRTRSLIEQVYADDLRLFELLLLDSETRAVDSLGALLSIVRIR